MPGLFHSTVDNVIPNVVKNYDYNCLNRCPYDSEYWKLIWPYKETELFDVFKKEGYTNKDLYVAYYDWT